MTQTRIDWPVDDMVRWYGDGWSLSRIAGHIQQHYLQVRRVLLKSGVQMRSRSNPGAANGCWRGGRKIHRKTYVLIYSPGHPSCRGRNNYVREHRLIAERILGRFLSPKEVVHHKDDNGLNNDPGNLVVYQTNGHHLAATLAGRVPVWSTDGLQRMKDRWERAERPDAIRKRSRRGGGSSKQKTNRWTGVPGIDLGVLLRKAAEQPQ